MTHMPRKLTLTIAALATSLGIADAAAAARPSASRAATAVERQVVDKYQSVIEDRTVLASCHPAGRDRFRCTYKVLKNFDDGRTDARTGSRGIYAAKGSAYAYVRHAGGFRVVAYTPRWL